MCKALKVLLPHSTMQCQSLLRVQLMKFHNQCWKMLLTLCQNSPLSIHNSHFLFRALSSQTSPSRLKHQHLSYVFLTTFLIRQRQDHILPGCIKHVHVNNRNFALVQDESHQKLKQDESDRRNKSESFVEEETTSYSRELSKVELSRLAAILHCNDQVMRNLVEKYQFFARISPHLVEAKVTTMVNHGISYQFIIEYPRLLVQVSAVELFNRLQQLKNKSIVTDNSVTSLPNLAYYLECPSNVFDYCLHKLCAEKQALQGCPDQLSYIQFRLQCTQEQAKSLLKKRYSNIRLKRVLDFFLIEAGLRPEFVISHRNVLTFSIERLRLRWKVMQSAGVYSESTMVYIWCMSEDDFNSKYSEYFSDKSDLPSK